MASWRWSRVSRGSVSRGVYRRCSFRMLGRLRWDTDADCLAPGTGVRLRRAAGPQVLSHGNLPRLFERTAAALRVGGSVSLEQISSGKRLLYFRCAEKPSWQERSPVKGGGTRSMNGKTCRVEWREWEK